MQREKYFEVYYTVFARDLILFLMVKKLYISITTFKKWPCSNDFRIDAEDRKVLSALCKYCSKVKNNNFMQEARFRNIRGSALKLICFVKVLYTYIAKVPLSVMQQLQHWEGTTMFIALKHRRQKFVWLFGSGQTRDPSVSVSVSVKGKIHFIFFCTLKTVPP